jgi:hypothetical protein
MQEAMLAAARSENVAIEVPNINQIDYAISNAFERLKNRRPSTRVHMQVTFVDVGHSNSRVIPHTWARARGRVAEECVTIAIIHAFFFLFGQPVRVCLRPGMSG